jgi:hypothetical protein
MNKRPDTMTPETKDLFDKVVEMFERTTGLKITFQYELLDETRYFDGLVRIEHQDMQWTFAVEAKIRVTRTTAALVKAEQSKLQEELMLITQYVTPPIADQMREIGLFFMDAAGNAYINKPPLYVFIKGNKPARNLKAAAPRRLLKTAGLKIVFTLLNNPNMVDQPYREIAAATDTALGTVGWIFWDLEEMGFLLKMGNRKRKMIDILPLMKKWAEAYPHQLRPKLLIERFKADDPRWWETVDIIDYGACWGGEVAAAKLTKRLKPGKVTIYANEPPGKLIIEKKLRKATDGNIEILKPFWKFDHKLTDQGIVPPLLVYTDLMATSDARNIETAGIIYDKYLAQLGRQD